MMATSVPSCGVCEYRQIFKAASIWCSECDEGLCLDCKEHHGISKATRKHDIIPISNYQKLPDYITNIKQICSTHDEKYKIFCNEHACTCCTKCIVDPHTKCHNIVNLDDVVKSTKTSNAFLEIHETLHEVAENIKRIRQDNNCNLKTLSENRNQIECEIQQVRLNINQHLDKLQENIIGELHEIEKREKTKINQLIQALDDHESKIDEHEKNIAYITQYASDLQTFLALKQLEANVDEKCQFIDSLSEVDTLNRLEIKCNINTLLTDITNTVPLFGKIQIDNSSSSVVIAKKKRKQAQLVVPRSAPVSIENIQAKLQHTINTESPAKGCWLLPNGRMVFCYPIINKVSIVRHDGSVDFSLTVTAPHGVAYNIEDDTIVISSCWGSRGNKVTIIDLTKRKVKKTISPGGQTIDIAATYKSLIYQIYNKAIRAMDLTYDATRDITTENMDSAINITIYGDKLYYSSYMYHTVVCYDLNGRNQWSFGNEDILKFPYGISADNDGNVYVVGYGNKNVVVISPDGQKQKELISLRDGLISPFAINFGLATNHLLVATENYKAYLYKVYNN